MKLGKYKHYKGNLYEVVGVAQHTETRQKMVVYKALYPCPDLLEEYGDEPLFVRPFDMFTGTVEIDGAHVPRFAFVGDSR